MEISSEDESLLYDSVFNVSRESYENQDAHTYEKLFAVRDYLRPRVFLNNV